MIYVLIIGSMIVGMLLCSFKLEFMKNRYLKFIMEDQLGEEPYEESRVRLLSKLNRYIKGNARVIDEISIDSLLKEIKGNEISYEESFIEYIEKDKEICLFLNTEEGLSREEYYKYKIFHDKEDKVLFNLTKIKS